MGTAVQADLRVPDTRMIRRAMMPLILLILHATIAQGSPKKCTKICATPGTMMTGSACEAVTYTLDISPSVRQLPSVKDFTNSLETRVNSSATVGCGGWDIAKTHHLHD